MLARTNWNVGDLRACCWCGDSCWLAWVRARPSGACDIHLSALCLYICVVWKTENNKGLRAEEKKVMSRARCWTRQREGGGEMGSHTRNLLFAQSTCFCQLLTTQFHFHILSGKKAQWYCDAFGIHRRDKASKVTDNKTKQSHGFGLFLSSLTHTQL